MPGDDPGNDLHAAEWICFGVGAQGRRHDDGNRQPSGFEQGFAGRDPGAGVSSACRGRGECTAAWLPNHARREAHLRGGRACVAARRLPFLEAYQWEFAAGNDGGERSISGIFHARGGGARGGCGGAPHRSVHACGSALLTKSESKEKGRDFPVKEIPAIKGHRGRIAPRGWRSCGC